MKPVKHMINLFLPTGAIVLQAQSYTTPQGIIRIVLPDDTVTTSNCAYMAVEVSETDVR